MESEDKTKQNRKKLCLRGLLPRGRRGWLTLAAVFVVLGGVCLANRGLLTERPFTAKHTFAGPSGAFRGASGRSYVIDEGKKTVLVLDASGRLLREIRGGSRTDAFYYASQVAEDSETGDIYIADVLYSGEGTIIGAERIIRYDSSGRNRKLVYQIDYSDEENPPMQYGRIQYLSVAGGKLTFITVKTGDITVYNFYPARNSISQTHYSVTEGIYISDLTYDPVGRVPVWTTRWGGIYTISQLGVAEKIADTQGVPFQITCCDGGIYYTDIQSGAILRADADGNTATVCTEVSAYYLDGGAGTLIGSDGAGVYTVAEDGTAEYAASAPVAHAVLRLGLWLLAALDALILCLFLAAGIKMLAPRLRGPSFERVIIILVVSAGIASVVAYLTLNTMFLKQNADVMDQLDMFAEILVSQADAKKLEKVDSIGDYRSDDYLAFRAPLDEITQGSYESGMYYYYTVYVTDGELIYGVCDFEDTVFARQPYDVYGCAGYTDVFETGETVRVSAETSMFGTYSFVLKPIKDSTGRVAGVLEVGVNLDNLNAAQQSLVVEIVMTVITAAVTLVMLILEGVFYLEERRSRAPDTGTLQDRLERIPVRSLFFVCVLVDSLQDPFVAILASRLFVPFWGLSAAVGGALPISAGVLAAALFSFAGGYILGRLGSRRTLALGFLVQIAGFLLCGLWETYTGLLIGKLLGGAGMGIITVAVNAVAAAGESEKFHLKAFGDVTAGMVAGVSAGAGLGSIILSVGSYRTVFLSGAAILLLGLVMTFTCPDYREARKAPAADRPAGQIGFARFFFSRKVFGLLVLALLPFAAGVSFRSYFFPLFAAEIGMSEEAIGRVLLACGILVIYGGPPVTKFMVEKLGSYVTVIISGVVMALATMLFALFPTAWALIVGVAAISVCIGTGGIAQSTYFSAQPAVSAYGESRAMGVYTVFDNAGQTLGPVLYGAALVLGSQAGVLIVGAILTVLVSAFVCVTTDGISSQKKAQLLHRK